MEYTLITIFMAISLTHSLPCEEHELDLDNMCTLSNTPDLDLRSNKDLDNYRLPNNVKPINYQIILEPQLDVFEFYGNTVILIEILERTRSIILHSVDIKYMNSEISVNKETIPHERILDKERELLSLNVSDILEPGHYVLKFGFIGKLNAEKRGFFRSSYKNETGNERWLVATSFKPTDARSVFPCFDEPALKATFDISLGRHEGYISLSNTKLKSSKDIGGKFIDTFETTPMMSTYLVGFVVSDFKSASQGRHTVYARPYYIEHGYGKLGLEVGVQILSEMEKYTGIPFAISKMDQIAIPDFQLNVENWGLVTYTENNLLWNEDTGTLARKQSIVVITAHKFAQQWFGNLVGPVWWKYAWINNGFAIYFRYYLGNMVKPTWRLNEQYVTKSVHNALLLDSSIKTRAISSDTKNRADIARAYGSTFYSKAGALLRMLQQILTEEVFKQGLRNYLSKMQYSAATPDDLWAILQKALNNKGLSTLPKNVDVGIIMKVWETQKGYPLIFANSDKETNTIVVSQKRFILFLRSHTDESKWYVPINYATKSTLDFTSTTPQAWLQPGQNLTLDIKDVGDGDWFIINKQAGGFYRVNYDTQNWKRLAAYLNSENFNKIHPLNRAQIIDDAFNLARTGYIDYGIALDFTKYLIRESDYIPLTTFFSNIKYLTDMLHDVYNYKVFEQYLSNLLNSALQNLGFTEKKGTLEDDEHINNLNRVNIIDWACKLGNPECLKQAQEKLKDLSKDSITFKSSMWCATLRHADNDTWNKFQEETNEIVDNEILNIRIEVLSCSEDNDILKKYVDIYLKDLKESVLKNICSRGVLGLKFVFNYILTDTETLIETIGIAKTGQLLKHVSKYVANQENIAKLAKLRDQHSNLAKHIDVGIRAMTGAIRWKAEYTPSIVSWISKELIVKNSNTPGTTAVDVTVTTTPTSANNVTATSPGSGAENVLIHYILLIMCFILFLVNLS